MKSPFGKPELKGLIIGLCLFIVGALISVLRYQVLIQEEKQSLNNVLDLIEQNIEKTIQESYNSALILALTVNSEGEVINFEKVAEQILKNNNSVDVLELVPDGVIEYVYPLEGNESVIGYDILSDPNVNTEVLKAAELGTIYFAGPFELRQGGMAVVGRLPIIINDEFWGYSAVLLYLETLIENSGINAFPEEKYYFQLSKINPNTHVEEFFLPEKEGVELGTYESVRFPEGDWRLYVTRIGNNIPLNSLLVIFAITFIGAILMGILSAKIFRKPLDLEELLQEKSAELLQSREKYKLSSELMESIFESPKSMIIFSLDRDYNYLAFSISHKETMKNLLGVDIKKGMNLLDIIPTEETRKVLKNDFDRALQGEHFDYIRAFQNKEGEPAYWESRFAPIISKDNQVVGLTSFVSNIDKRVKAEKEILLEKQLSDSIINSLPGVFYLYNKEGTFLRWNKNFETVTGYSSEEMKRAHPLDFFDESEKELLAEKIENVFISGEDLVEANFMRKDGSKIPYYFTGASINYQGEECLLGVGIDISEQKEAQAEYLQVLKRLQTHLNNSPLGVVEYDKNLNITQWSNRCEHIFGWKADEIIGKNAFELIYEEDKEQTKEVASELSDALVDWNVSFNRNYTKSGEIIHCIWYNSVIKNEDGSVNTVMSLVEDITERKKAEELVEKSLKEKTTLLTEIHHRVKNNLAIVSGLLQLQIYEINDEKLSSVLEQSINRIISIAMVHELMYRSTDLSSINIHTYLEKLIPAITATMKDDNKNINIDINIDDYKMNINEAIPLGLLLNELFTNSFKYAFTNKDRGSINVSLTADHSLVKVVYEDNGNGFDSAIDFDKPKNLGLNLIHAQLQQLGASYSAITKDKFRLEFNFTHSKSGSHATI